MFGLRQTGGCLITLLVLVACNEPQGDPATGPDLGKGGNTSAVKPGSGSSTVCDFQAVHSAVVAYFEGQQQSDIDGLVSDMEDAPNLAAARTIGYQIMDAIGARSRSATLTASELLAGENLTKGLIKCSYDLDPFDLVAAYEFPNFPDGDVYDFAKALDAPNGGAYFVRRPTDDNGTAVLGQIGGITKSGIAPPPLVNWSAILDEEVLIHGWPVGIDDPSGWDGSYEWALIRPNTIFDPEGVIALCVPEGATNVLIEESNIGYLAWGGDGEYICNGTITGTYKTLKSLLSPAPFNQETDAINLAVPIGPGKTQKANVEFTILVSAKIGGVGTNSVCALLSGFNNTGQVATLLGESNCDSPGFKQLARKTETTFLDFVDGKPVPCTPSSANQNCKPVAGYATFKVTIPSPGAMSMTVTGVQTVGNNLTLTITPASIPRFNVKP